MSLKNIRFYCMALSASAQNEIYVFYERKLFKKGFLSCSFSKAFKIFNSNALKRFQTSFKAFYYDRTVFIALNSVGLSAGAVVSRKGVSA